MNELGGGGSSYSNRPPKQESHSDAGSETYLPKAGLAGEESPWEGANCGGKPGNVQDSFGCTENAKAKALNAILLAT